MKNHILLLFVFITFQSYTQDPGEARLIQIDTEIQKAIQAEDYAKAADLKKEKEYRIKINEAVAAGNYEEAARLKKEMESTVSTVPISVGDIVEYDVGNNVQQGEVLEVEGEEAKVKPINGLAITRSMKIEELRRVLKSEDEKIENEEENVSKTKSENNADLHTIGNVISEMNLKVGSMQTEKFYFGFAAGDKIVLSMKEESKKELKEVEVLTYSGSSKFKTFKTDQIIGKEIDVPETGIYVFNFSNGSLGKRVCDIKISRIPGSPETESFNSTVYWKTIYDTSYYTVQEKYLISKDTAINNVANKVVKVHSTTNLNGNKTSFNFTLPNNTVAWSYYVGVNQAGQQAFEEATEMLAQKAAPLVAKIPGYGPLAALALGSTSYIAKLQRGEDIDYYIVDNSNVNLFLGGTQFYYIMKGKVINDFSQMTKPLKGTYHFCFMNDNAVTGVSVTVKVTAVTVTENWGTRPVEKMKVTSRQIGYLKN